VARGCFGCSKQTEERIGCSSVKWPLLILPETRGLLSSLLFSESAYSQRSFTQLLTLACPALQKQQRWMPIWWAARAIIFHTCHFLEWLILTWPATGQVCPFSFCIMSTSINSFLQEKQAWFCRGAWVCKMFFVVVVVVVVFCTASLFTFKLSIKIDSSPSLKCLQSFTLYDTYAKRRIGKSAFIWSSCGSFSWFYIQCYNKLPI